MTISPNFDPLKLGQPLTTPPKPASESQPDPTTLTQQPEDPQLLHLAFNPDHSCFSAATSSGFHVFACDHFRRCDSSSAPRGGVRIVQTLHHCHYLAVLGGGPDPLCNPNKVMIWDDRRSRVVGGIQFRSDVMSVRLRPGRIVVVLLNKIFVYNFDDVKALDSMVTLDNPKGLCEVSQKPGPAVLACPGVHPGQIRVHNYGSNRTKFITAHSSALACFALTLDGQFIATASCKGTLIRVFNTSNGTLLQEVRRGAEKAEIYSLAFSPSAQWLAASSDKGTVHVFSVKVDAGSLENDGSRNTSDISRTNPSAVSSLSYFKAVLPRYFSSEWSVARFRLQEGVKYIVAFGHQKNTVIIVGMDGSFYRCQFDPASVGEMTQLEYSNFLKSE